jgi:hypothetical protein
MHSDNSDVFGLDDWERPDRVPGDRLARSHPADLVQERTVASQRPMQLQLDANPAYRWEPSDPDSLS